MSKAPKNLWFIVVEIIEWRIMNHVLRFSTCVYIRTCTMESKYIVLQNV